MPRAVAMRLGPSLWTLLVPPARQRKSSPKEHHAKHRREPSRWPVVGRTPQDANCPNAKRHPNAKTSKQKDVFPYYHRRLQSTVHLPSEIKKPGFICRVLASQMPRGRHLNTRQTLIAHGSHLCVTDCLRRERGVSDRHGRARGADKSFNLST